jgi:ubiquinone/menaquinone biosynthesis C-methylase UbiE
LNLTEIESSSDEIEEATLTCEKGHAWKVEESIPLLVYPSISTEDAKWISDYDQMAENYDELVKQYDDWLDIDMMKERESIAQFIPIEGPSRIIDVSIGTAGNFMALANVYPKQMGRFNLHGLDVSRRMLRVAQRKMRVQNFTFNLVHGSVFNIPYVDNFFDIVVHSGGINTFSDIPKALEEMLRIAKPGGVVLVIDEGVSPKVRATERGKAIIEANSLFAATPPINQVPDSAKDLEIEYIMNGTFYQMIFRK